jgi:hypothetical protein
MDYEIVPNEQGKGYLLVVPMFLTYGKMIFRWNRKDSKYDRISYDTFLLETNQNVSEEIENDVTK